MLRICVVMALAIAAAFAVDLAAQPPARQQDDDRSPRPEQRDGDRDGDRGDRGPRDGDRSRGFRMPPHPVVVALDADKNGELSQDEINNAAKSLMSLDKNGDMKLSGDEIRPEYRPGGPRPDFDPAQFTERLMQADANNDGKLEKSELPERMQQGFDRLDSNSDGAIDKAELDELAKRFGDRGDGDRRGPRGPRDGDRPDGDRPERNRPGSDQPQGDAPDADAPVEDAPAPISNDDL